MILTEQSPARRLGQQAPKLWHPERTHAPAVSQRDDVMHAGTWDMGIGLNQSIGSVMGGAPPFYPADLSGWFWFIDPNKYTSVTPGTTLLASGGATAVAALTGAKASRGAIRIQCTSSTLFQWGYDNDGTTATWTQTGQTIPAGGSAFTLGSTGLAATFPAGTYANGHTYEETVSAIIDEAHPGNSFVQATANKQPRLLKGINGAYGLRGDGVDDSMFNSVPSYPTQTLGVINWHWGVGTLHTVANFNNLLQGDAAVFLQVKSATTLAMAAGAYGSVVTFTPNTAARWSAKFTGTALADSFKWGSTTGSALNAGAAAGGSGAWLFGKGAGQYTQATLYACGVSSAEATGANLTALEAWGALQYGSAPF